MKKTFKIKQFEPGQEAEISKLIRTVFDEFEAPEYSLGGNLFFYDYIAPGNIVHRQLSNNTLWVATSRKMIVGMIEIRDENKISLLFVDKTFHHQGIATALINKALDSIRKNYPKTETLNVHSSPYAVPFYTKYGFSPVDDFQLTNGIRYLPMGKKLIL